MAGRLGMNIYKWTRIETIVHRGEVKADSPGDAEVEINRQIRTGNEADKEESSELKITKIGETEY